MTSPPTSQLNPVITPLPTQDNTNTATTGAGTTTTTTSTTTTNPTTVENKDETDENLYYKNLALYKNKKAEFKKTKMKVRAPINRNIVAWLGGSIVSQNNDFQTNAMFTKAQFKEYGYSIVFC